MYSHLVLPTGTVQSIFLSLFGIFLLQLLLRLRRLSRNVGSLPCQFLVISPLSTIGFMIGRMIRQIPYIHVESTWALKRKHEDFITVGQDAFTLLSAFPSPTSIVYIADAAAVKEITTHRHKFPKPLFRHQALGIFGPNIFASVGDEWKRYRKLTAPAFSEKNNKLVWDEAVETMNDLFDNVWGDKSEIIVDHCVDMTLSIALSVMSAAEFGHRTAWTSDLVVPPGHKMTFRDALRISCTKLIQKCVAPDWSKPFSKDLRKIDLAFTEIKQYMLEMVKARRNADKAEQRHDVFGGLLDATENETNSKAALTDEEFMGNIFGYLFGGHETSTHTLCFTFAMLALHPGEQESLYKHIKGVISSLKRMPTYEDMSRFTQSLAVLYETLRLFPQEPLIPKIAAEDTTLTVGNIHGRMTTFPVPSGTQIDIHVPGLHYNPRYWAQPHKFMPDRFLGDWPKDAFVPFSQGARSCQGRSLFETEGVAVLMMLVSRYKIEVKEEPEFSRETFEERYARITAFDQNLTPVPLRVPLVFKRR